MSDTTQPPADVRERWQTDSPEWRAKYFDLADRILALLRAPRGERPAGPLDAAEWADLDEAVPLPEPLTDAERAEGLARIRADRMRRTPRGEGEAEALAAEILAELRRAREKFPGDNVTTLALVEEVGELAKATFEESRDRVREEAVQVAAMAMRVVLDGDQTLDAWRESKGLDPLTAARQGEHEDPLVKEAVALIDEAVSEIAGDCQCYEEGESNG